MSSDDWEREGLVVEALEANPRFYPAWSSVDLRVSAFDTSRKKWVHVCQADRAPSLSPSCHFASSAGDIGVRQKDKGEEDEGKK